MLSRRSCKVTDILFDYTYDPQYQFEYFDLEEKLWKRLSKASTLPHRASLVVAKQKLYAVVAGGSMYARGLRGDPGSVKEFYEYNTKQNKWIKLPSMLNSHEIKASQVLYMDGFIYVIGGQLYSGTAERFSIAEQRWEELPDLPSYYNWTSAIAYRGKILVYGVYIDDSPHEILEYNPGTNMWQEVLSEEFPHDADGAVKPVLFVHEDQAYRFMYKSKPEEIFDPMNPQPYAFEPTIDIPTVNKLDQPAGGRIAIGEEVPQKVRIIAKTKGAFCLQDQVFICTKGFILPIDLNQSGEDAGRSLEKKWNNFVAGSSQGDCSNIINLAFCRKELGCIPPKP